MRIEDIKYNWNGSFERRSGTKYIVVHHRAGLGDAQSIHKDHLNRGYTGIGYHFYVRQNGGIYKGRPIATVGAHCKGVNDISVGVCFEGNFETESGMPRVQIKAGQELIEYLKGLYPLAEVKRHGELLSTACPGKNFPFDEIKKGVIQMTVDEAVEIVQAKAGIEDGTIEFLLCYKYGEELIVKLAEAMR